MNKTIKQLKSELTQAKQDNIALLKGLACIKQLEKSVSQLQRLLLIETRKGKQLKSTVSRLNSTLNSVKSSINRGQLR